MSEPEPLSFLDALDELMGSTQFTIAYLPQSFLARGLRLCVEKDDMFDGCNYVLTMVHCGVDERMYIPFRWRVASPPTIVEALRMIRVKNQGDI